MRRKQPRERRARSQRHKESRGWRRPRKGNRGEQVCNTNPAAPGKGGKDERKRTQEGGRWPEH